MKKILLFLCVVSALCLSGCVQVSNQLDAYFENVSRDIVFDAATNSVLDSDCRIISSDKISGVITFVASKNGFVQNNDITATIRIQSKKAGIVNVSVKAILPGQMIDVSNGPGSLIQKVLKNIEKDINSPAILVYKEGEMPSKPHDEGEGLK